MATPLSTRITKATGRRYAVALLATLVALLVRLALNPLLGDYVPYVTLFPAVAFCAWYCGIGPSILSVVLALIGAKYWFIPPAHSLRIIGTAQVVGIHRHGTGRWYSGVLVSFQCAGGDGRGPPSP